MYLTAEKKREIFNEHGKSADDTGRTESQIALFSYRITHLTGHLKEYKNDHGTRRALLKLVSKRRRLLQYLKNKDIERYRAILKKLGLRK
jgi:small subunit ribosomal protein S15